MSQKELTVEEQQRRGELGPLTPEFRVLPHYGATGELTDQQPVRLEPSKPVPQSGQTKYKTSREQQLEAALAYTEHVLQNRERELRATRQGYAMQGINAAADTRRDREDLEVVKAAAVQRNPVEVPSVNMGNQEEGGMLPHPVTDQTGSYVFKPLKLRHGQSNEKPEPTPVNATTVPGHRVEDVLDAHKYGQAARKFGDAADSRHLDVPPLIRPRSIGGFGGQQTLRQNPMEGRPVADPNVFNPRESENGKNGDRNGRTRSNGHRNGNSTAAPLQRTS